MARLSPRGIEIMSDTITMKGLERITGIMLFLETEDLHVNGARAF